MNLRLAVPLALLCAPAPLAAQLRGAVVDAAGGAPVPYALVSLGTRASQQFSDDNGWFLFAGLPAGEYRLSVRQVGFHPVDTTVVIGGQTRSMRIELRRLPIMLAALTSRSERRCRGEAAPGSTSLTTVFEQLRQNAERARLLADQYPFMVRVERRLTVHRSGGRNQTDTDTLILTSWTRWPYAPGRVVTPDPSMVYTSLVHLPELADFADSAFQANHCFQLLGFRPYQGQELVQLDFRASRELREPDVEGSVWLDPASYQIRHMLVRLTRLDRAARGVSDWVASTAFAEIMPNVTVADRVSVATSYTVNRRRDMTDRGRSEEQRMIGVEFRRGIPSQRDSSP